MVAGSSLAQDVHFSQYVSLPVYVNPALAGAHAGKFRINAVYRDQWRAIPAPFTTYGLTADLAITSRQLRNDVIGVGVFLYQDRAGETGLGFVTNEVRLIGSFHKSLGYTQFISGGILLNYAMRRVDYTNAKTDNQWNGWQYDETRPIGENFSPVNVFDMGIGAALYGVPTDKMQYMVGASAYHPLRPNISIRTASIDKLHIRWGIHGQMAYALNQKLALVPGLWAWMQGPHWEGIGGALVRINLAGRRGGFGRGPVHALSVGAMYRVLDALVPIVRYEYMGFTISASYDLTMSSLARANGGQGGLEIGIGYIALPKRARSTIRKPRF